MVYHPLYIMLLCDPNNWIPVHLMPLDIKSAVIVVNVSYLAALVGISSNPRGKVSDATHKPMAITAHHCKLFQQLQCFHQKVLKCVG